MLLREIVKEFGCGPHLAAKILSLAVVEQRPWQDKRATTEPERHKAGPGPERVLHFDELERPAVFQIQHRRENRIVYGFEFEHQLLAGFATRKDAEDECDNLIRHSDFWMGFFLFLFPFCSFSYREDPCMALTLVGQHTRKNSQSASITRPDRARTRRGLGINR